jgi:hypothetical protein
MGVLFDGEPVYPGESFWYTIPRAVVFDGTARQVLTPDNPPTTFFAQIVALEGAQGNESPVNMAYVPARKGSWTARLTAPNDSGEYMVQAVALKSGGRGEWRDTFTVS